jgi:hydrogenase nickel incorporation protein HypA/HybF
MHELSITQGVVDICESSSAGRRVTSVTLEIGELSGVIPDAVEFCFEACTRDTPLEGARLIINRIPARGKCDDCSAEFSLRAYYESCPVCASCRVTILSGEELRVKELEVD